MSEPYRVAAGRIRQELTELVRVVDIDALTDSLPARLVEELHRLAQKYQAYGLDLFVFGSFARGDQAPISDLDLGVEWRRQPDPKIFTRLYWEVQALPTIRKIELVDFARTDPAFRRIAAKNKLYLSEPRSVAP
jgi:predicted nucleotidyltransferase